MRRGTFHDHLNCKESLLDIAEHLRALELELLTNTTRKNAARVSSLLADTLREFGSSGRVYPKNDIIIALQEEAPVSISLIIAVQISGLTCIVHEGGESGVWDGEIVSKVMAAA
jgi:hypothetical protein